MCVPRADSARTRPHVEDGANLVLLQPVERTDAELAGHLVALLFAAATPISVIDVARLLDTSAERLDHILEVLRDEPLPGLAIQRHAEALQLTTAAASSSIVERFLGAPPPVRLSRAATEALAVIAYRQPVTRGDIDAVRGVNSDSAVATLLSRGLVAEVGRRETVGRPALLAVTTDCLQYLGVSSLDELPPLPAAAAHVGTAPADDSTATEGIADDAAASHAPHGAQPNEPSEPNEPSQPNEGQPYEGESQAE